MMRLDARLRTNNNQTLDEVAKLANISGPRMAQQNFHSRVSQLARLLSISCAELVQEVFGQNGNVLFAVAQRRHEEGNYIQPIEKVLAESATGNFLLEVFVGSGQDADVNGHSLAGTDWLKALLLEHAQHFRLRAQAHVSDFIEKERAAVGFLLLEDLVVP